ncbi:MAG TPA: hypothetical protein VGX46_02110 [Vicinamibacterales bacterium]|jgi:hypothetical protein|nr:hypothetical protein [Vicinamibacterales bacterium]
MGGVAGRHQLPQPGHKRTTRKRRLKREIEALQSERANAREHHAARGNRALFGSKADRPLAMTSA